MSTFRQCRVCGQYRHLELFDQETRGAGQTSRWCRHCSVKYNQQQKSGKRGKRWVQKMQVWWDYVPRQINPDKEVE